MSSNRTIKSTDYPLFRPSVYILWCFFFKEHQRLLHSSNHLLNIFTGYRVREVAHDYVPAIKTWLEKEKGILNSYDTWHGKFKLFIFIIFNSYNLQNT